MLDLLKRHEPFLIAEVAQAHDGSLGFAHSYIDAAAQAGAHAIKFQTHIASAESTLDEPWRVKFSYADRTRYDYWKRMEFSEEQWAELARHAESRGLTFLSSPFSVAAVELLGRIGQKTWKIASGEINNPELLEAIWARKETVLFSSGMSGFEDLDPVVARTRQLSIPYAVFQCTSEYPCPPEHWGLNNLAEIRKRYDCPAGFSDHSGTPNAGIIAAALGASFIEVHVAFDRGQFGPDAKSSLTFQELAQLAQACEQVAITRENPVNKSELAKKLAPLKEMFGRSLALTNDLPKGTLLTRANLTLKKPGSGIPYTDMAKVIGKSLKKDKSAQELLRLDDLEKV
jgi:N,N'-diacetyllegionaminate synthase